MHFVLATPYFGVQQESASKGVISKSQNNSEMELEEEQVKNGVSSFSGVDIHHSPDTSQMKLVKKELAKQIIEELNTEHMLIKQTSTQVKLLMVDVDSDPPGGSHDCVSVVGMLQCTHTHLRSNNTCAISQVARVTHGPKRLQKIALEHIRKL